MTLKRREKRRYISVMHAGLAAEAEIAIVKRLEELYGSIGVEKASLKVVMAREMVSIFRCTLGQEANVLVAIALGSHAMVALDMSSSMKRLKKRLAVKINTAKWNEKDRG